MKISRLLLTTTLFIGGGIIPIFNVEAGYLNSAGGNIYGDSDINPMADPDINPMADPDINPMADPDINPMADPDINPCADPYISPMGC